MDLEDISHSKTNRQKKMSPITCPPMWCARCDREVVRVGHKCNGCGYYNGPKKRQLRKDTSSRH